jgi:predicted ATPase/DNA-binding winged helix-turn-helix (wHTH) protein
VNSLAPRSFAFGAFLLIPQRQTLMRDGAPVRLGGRALDILTVLVNRAGELVTKRELLAQVWPDTVVEDGSLKVHMAAVRRALGDVPATASYIATVTGRGYRFIAPVQAADLPAPMTAAPGPMDCQHNLPARHASIFGRCGVIALLRSELAESRLLSIVGPNGVGKTTVAIAVAELALGSFKDGVWLIDLSTLSSAASVPNAVAAVLGLPLDGLDGSATLCDALRGREMLLVLDGCDHLIDAVAHWADRLLTSTVSVKILTTSREALQIAGERVRRLPGLGTPPPSSRLSATQALCFPAVQFFVEQASASFELFEFGDADAAAVSEVCRRLDGLALAIELVATRLGEFGVNGLKRKLDDRCHLLACRRAGPERHRSLEAMLDWSCGLLTCDEISVLRAVSVFEGEFELEGASFIASLSGAEASETLMRLATKSLVMADFRGHNAKYRLMETTRSYCRERLKLSGEETLLRRRHAQYLLQAAQQQCIFQAARVPLLAY